MTDVLDRPALLDEHRVRMDALPDHPLADHHDHPMAGRVSSLVMLLPVRIFLVAGWLRASAEKLIDGRWWSGANLRTFLTEQHDQAIPFFRPVMDHVIAPAAPLVAFVVMITQLLCGVAIATGRGMRLALRWAFLLNVVFILAGRVNPSAFYLVMEVVLLFAIADGTIGHRHSTPSHRTFVAAGMSTLFALAFVPYIRTIQPAGVIDDPAMMLSFMGVVVATTLVVRRAAHPEYHHTRLGQLWTQRLHSWSSAAPREQDEGRVTAR